MNNTNWEITMEKKYNDLKKEYNQFLPLSIQNLPDTAKVRYIEYIRNNINELKKKQAVFLKEKEEQNMIDMRNQDKLKPYKPVPFKKNIVNPPPVRINDNKIRLYTDPLYVEFKNEYKDILIVPFNLKVNPNPSNEQLPPNTFKTYKSVSNYIFSKYLDTCSFDVKQIEDILPELAKNKSLELYNECIENVIYFCTYKALSIKMKTDPEALSFLLNTGNSSILFDTVIPLGIGKYGTGKNIYGNILVQLRRLYNIIKQKELVHDVDTNIYNIYMYYQTLNELSKKEDNFGKYYNKPYEYVINDYKTKYGPLDDIIQSKSSFISNLNEIREFYKNKENNPMSYIDEEIKNPGTIFYNIRKKNLQDMNIKMELKKNDIIIDLFLNYLIKKKYPEIPEIQYTLIKQQNFSGDNLTELRNRVVNLFKIGMLSASLSDKIDETINKLQEDSIIYSKETINKMIADNEMGHSIVKPPLPKVTESVGTTLVKNKTVIVYNNPEQNEASFFLSPYREHGMIEIDGLLYPSILHYTYTYLIHQIPVQNDLKDMYSRQVNKKDFVIKQYSINFVYKKYIINTKVKDDTFLQLTPDQFFSINDIVIKYNMLSTEHINNNLKEYTKRALEIKFKSTNMSEKLKNTGNKQLLYDDSLDDILGTGVNGNGNNYIGKLLMEIRTKNNEELVSGLDILLDETTEISDYTIIEQDFLRNWIRMKVFDMCNIISIIIKYSNSKNNINININNSDSLEYVKYILDVIYNPCSKFTPLTQKNEVPSYFKNFILTRDGFENVNDIIIFELWKRVSIMISLIKRTSKNTKNKNIITIINSITKIISNKKKCIKIIENETDNCIVSAILNILKGVLKFNKKHDLLSFYQLEDVMIAKEIIIPYEIHDDEDYNNEDNSDDTKKIYKNEDDDPNQDDEIYVEIEDDLDDPENISENSNDEESDIDIDKDEGSDDEKSIDFNFGFNPDISDLENIRIEAEKIFNGSTINYLKLASDILVVKDIIKNSNTNSFIKNNRINFFASI